MSGDDRRGTGGGGPAPEETAPSEETARGPIRVAAVDDHPVLRWGLSGCLAELAPDIEWLGLEVDVTGLLARPGPVPSVVLLDIELGDGTTVGENVARLRAAGCQVLLYTQDQRPVIVRQGIEAGALGLLPKKEEPSGELVEAVRAAHVGTGHVNGPLAHQIVNDPRGRVRLSERQLDVLKLLARGWRDREIGEQLFISADTVKTHRQRALRALAGPDGDMDGRDLVLRSLLDGHVEVRPDGPEER